MKIGILTLPLHTNYGGNLQAYALYQVLTGMGHEVWLINRQGNRKAAWKIPLAIVKRAAFKYLLGKKEVEVFLERKRKKEYPVISQFTQPFIDKNIPRQTQAFYSSAALEKEIEVYGFDAIIVGSDQVWRPEYTPNLFDYFLGFLGDSSKTKRISYAASFGSDKWHLPEDQTNRISRLLRKFNAVSVRERSGIDLCRRFFDVDAKQVLDPTMLLDAEIYQKLVGRDEAERQGVLVYVLDETADTRVVSEKVSVALGTVCYRVNSLTEDGGAALAERIAPPVESWIKGFMDAEFVITDSFHACVFSILFKKPFLVLGNKGRGLSRFESLLDMFGLSERLISSAEDVSGELIDNRIDWDEIYLKLDRKRMESILFLTDALNH